MSLGLVSIQLHNLNCDSRFIEQLFYTRYCKNFFFCLFAYYPPYFPDMETKVQRSDESWLRSNPSYKIELRSDCLF